MFAIPLADLAGAQVTGIAASDRDAGRYALFADGKLFLADLGARTAAEVAKLPTIDGARQTSGEPKDWQRTGEGEQEHMTAISIAFHDPYVCVTERFGLHGALASLANGRVHDLSREDYHSNVSSYSIGFLEREGRVLLICQTRWNRLDILDAETGENLTQREVWCRRTDQKTADGNPTYEKKNYLDYFQSQLHVSPDGRHFLSNGWVWQPWDQIRVFDTERFFTSYEPGSFPIESGSGYNWDRPCCFVDDDLFVIADDDMTLAGELDDEERSQYVYRQLAFYRVNGERTTNAYGFSWLKPCERRGCQAFPLNRLGEVRGKLYFDPTREYLVAIAPEGAHALSLDGQILASLPDVVDGSTLDQHDNWKHTSLGWGYSPEHHVCYTWQDGVGIVERRFPD